jgi:hypothetical protein
MRCLVCSSQGVRPLQLLLPVTGQRLQHSP